MRYLPLLVLLSLAMPTAAVQTFHLQEDLGLSLDPPEEGFEVPVSPWARDLGEAHVWRHTMEEAGELYPVSGAFTLVIKDPTVFATLPVGDGCGLTAYVGIQGERYLYYCLILMNDVPRLPGEHRFTFETQNPDIEPIPYTTGDVLFFEVTTLSTHTDTSRSLFVAPGDEGAFLVLEGTQEPAEGEDPPEDPETTPEPTPEPTGAPTTEPSPGPTTPTAGPSEAPESAAAPPTGEPVDQHERSPGTTAESPALPILVLLAGLLALVRRRR